MLGIPSSGKIDARVPAREKRFSFPHEFCFFFFNVADFVWRFPHTSDSLHLRFLVLSCRVASSPSLFLWLAPAHPLGIACIAKVFIQRKDVHNINLIVTLVGSGLCEAYP